MSESKFKNLRHVETVRNYIDAIIHLLIDRAERHDQSKFESPEVEIFEEYVPKLKNVTYGSEQYKQYMKEMTIAIEHHHKYNRHHPEHFKTGIKEMNLIDIIELLCDWISASKRHSDGDVYRSIEINQKRFDYSDDIKRLLKNTIDILIKKNVFHRANES